MNLTYTRPGELRKPDVDVLPDGRIRITRYIAAGHGDRDYSEVTESVGTADNGLATALLVKKGMAQINGKDAIVKTYEVRNASSETLVGLPDVQYTESGQKTMVYDYVQMSSGTYTPGTIGTTQAPGDATCILRTEQTEDDGTTRQIRRVFINKGLLQQVDETKNNGALLLKTFVYLNDAPVPNPPTGYTLISQRTENPNGLETTTYTYAKGSGQISQDDTTSNNGALLRRIIRYITAPSAANPIATPSGYTLIDESYQDSDGHRIWTATYAKGTGEISQDTRYVQSINQGTDGVTVITIRYLSTPSVTVNPITTPVSPAGLILISSDRSDQDGHRVWSSVFAKGVGTVVNDVDIRNNGKLKIYHKVALGAAPTTPSSDPSIGGTVVLINQNQRNDSGYVIYDYTWAEGKGTVNYSYDIRISGCLAVHQTTSLAVAPSNPSLVISGTLVNVSQKQRQDSGLIIYDYEWVEVVTSTVSLTTRAREDGSMVYGISVSSTTQSTPAYPGTGTGYLVDDSYERNNGYYINKATYIKVPDSYDFPKQVSFTVPGLLVAANPPVQSPPVNKSLMATAYVTFSTTKTTDVPYKIDTYAELSITYKRKDNQRQYAEFVAKDGYVGNSSYVATNVNYGQVAVDSIAITVSGASPTTRPSGVTILAVDCEKYLTTTSGTTVWRNVSIKYTF